MKKSNKYIYALMSLALAACSDDFSVPDNSGIDENGNVNVNLTIPDMNTVDTRSADEWQIGSFQMVVVEGSAIKQVTDFDLSDLKSVGSNKFSLRFQLLDELKSKSNLDFYFLANVSGNVGVGDAIATLRSNTFTNLPSSNEKMPMSAITSMTSITSGAEVVLYRNDAKVTLYGGTVADNGSVTVNTAETYPYAVYGTAASSSIVAGADQANPILGNPTAISLPSALSVTPTEVYVHPTQNTGSSNEFKSYIIVKADYKNVGYYYRLDFQEKKTVNGKETIQAIDIKPNHHYQVVITGVNGAGYASPTEAAANPTTMVEYVIHDHAPVVYNMITDGIRELGVSHEVNKNGNDDAFLYVKTYSPVASEESKDLITITPEDAWISFEYVGEASENEMGGDINDNSSSNGAGNTKGKVFKYKAVLDNSKTLPGSVSGSVNISWQKLNRNVVVNWIREFDGAMLCSVGLTIKDSNNNTQWNIENKDYWTFLKDEVYGVTVKANNGEVRNAGLHFPVMYGESGKTWSYEYEITLKDEVCPANSDWNVEVDAASRANFNLEITKKGGNTFTVKRIANSTNDWDYAVGKLNITVNDIVYPLDIYHTGFFHKDSQSHRVDTQDATHFYYYEVVSAGDRHWLDRNLGAKSAEYYIDDVAAYNDSRDAIGGYYRVADYKKYGEPAVYTDLCPPGFALPTQSEWDELRKSAAFSTALDGSNYLAEYRSPDKTIYFPKARYREENSTVLVGDARSGYYWTSSPFTGTEKEEVGNWLKCLVFSGNSTSTISGQVNGKDGKNGYAMAVRCINKSNAGNSAFVTRLNVRGATHIYLYTEKDGVRTPTTTWPGHSIGNYETVKDSYFSFSFESASISADELYVIFNYLDKDGVVHTISNDVFGSGVTPTTINPKYANGWRVNGDTYANLYDSSNANIAGNAPTKNNYYWYCKDVTTDSPSAFCYKSEPGGNAQGGDITTTELSYRIVWPKEWGGIYRYDIYFHDSNPSSLNGWKKNNDNYGNENYYVFKSTTTPTVSFDLCSDQNGGNKRSYNNISSFSYNKDTGYYEYRISSF